MASFDRRLVLEVIRHRQLWDRQCNLSKQACAMEAAWIDVASKLAVTVEKCQARWRAIRDSYLMRKKRQRGISGGQGIVLEHELDSVLEYYLEPHTRSVVRPEASESEPGDGDRPDELVAVRQE